MIYYCDDEIEIRFNYSPTDAIRIRKPFSPEDKVDCIKYPVWNSRDLIVTILDYKQIKKYEFLIEKHTKSDGATIPRLVWSLIGVTPTDNRVLVGAFLHDFLCKNKDVIDRDRSLSTLALDRCCYVGGLNAIQRFLIKYSVAFWQMFCGW